VLCRESGAFGDVRRHDLNLGAVESCGAGRAADEQTESRTPQENSSADTQTSIPTKILYCLKKYWLMFITHSFARHEQLLWSVAPLSALLEGRE
jgi:hypothetical protein